MPYMYFQGFRTHTLKLEVALPYSPPWTNHSCTCHLVPPTNITFECNDPYKPKLNISVITQIMFQSSEFYRFPGVDPARKSWGGGGGGGVVYRSRPATSTGIQRFGRKVYAAGQNFGKNRVFNPFSKHFRLETVKLLRVKNMQNQFKKHQF